MPAAQRASKLEVGAFGPAQFAQLLPQDGKSRLALGVDLGIVHDHAKPPLAMALLRSRRERPRRRTAEERDELAAFHSTTSSASASSLSGIVMPRRPLARQATERRNSTREPPYWAVKQ